MNPVTIVLLVILAVLIIAVVALYFFGKKAQKKQAEQQQQIEAYKQSVSMLIIDKKRMRLKDAGLPDIVMAQTPKLLRRAKLPIVKAKVGPQIMTLVCEDSIFDSVPVKKEVKATVSGIYITAVKGLHEIRLQSRPEKEELVQAAGGKTSGKGGSQTAEIRILAAGHSLSAALFFRADEGKTQQKTQPRFLFVPL